MSELMIYNELSNSIERFEPLSKNSVKMFICGPTVQDRMHIGHARTYVFYDVLARYLTYLGYNVKTVINITDIDESILDAAKSSGKGVEPFIHESILNYRNDLRNLGIESIYKFEPVSKYIDEMKRQISQLMNKGYAYVASEGVFFDVSKANYFGEISHMSRQELSIRPIELYPDKKGILDFSLWRRVPYDELIFDSPWGKGWPGWHIQDTAIAISELGAQYDIHGGAYELIYPHHEAEKAIGESLNGVSPYVKYWVYTGLITISGRKMSKSERNTVYLHDLLSKYGVDSLRLYLLSTPYRKNMEFTKEGLKAVADELKGLREKFENVNEYGHEYIESERLAERLFLYMNNDMDISSAIKFLINVAERPGSVDVDISLAAVKSVLRKLSSIMGVNMVGS